MTNVAYVSYRSPGFGGFFATLECNWRRDDSLYEPNSKSTPAFRAALAALKRNWRLVDPDKALSIKEKQARLELMANELVGRIARDNPQLDRFIESDADQFKYAVQELVRKWNAEAKAERRTAQHRKKAMQEPMAKLANAARLRRTDSVLARSLAAREEELATRLMHDQDHREWSNIDSSALEAIPMQDSGGLSEDRITLAILKKEYEGNSDVELYLAYICLKDSKTKAEDCHMALAHENGLTSNQVRHRIDKGRNALKRRNYGAF